MSELIEKDKDQKVPAITGGLELSNRNPRSFRRDTEADAIAAKSAFEHY